VSHLVCESTRFHWEMNKNQMATEMRASGIRGFARDLEKLRPIVRQQVE
jgi:transaldolase